MGSGLAFCCKNNKKQDLTPFPFRHTAEDLLKNAVTPNKHGISPLARSIDKHSSRSGSVYDLIAGSPNIKNAAAQNIAVEIMDNPGTVVIEKMSTRYGKHLDIIAPDGRGLRFAKNGNFIGVLEP